MKLIDGLAMINSTKGGLPQPLSIEAWSFNEAKSTGGELLKLDNVIGCGSNHNAMEKGTVTVKPANGKGHQTTLHIRFIEKVNGERVYW